MGERETVRASQSPSEREFEAEVPSWAAPELRHRDAEALSELLEGYENQSESELTEEVHEFCRSHGIVEEK